jgi:hypothetical protein
MKEMHESPGFFSQFLDSSTKLASQLLRQSSPTCWLMALLFSITTPQIIQASPILLWNNSNQDQLVGAHGVEVLGQIYDVDFYEGSCRSKWGGCNPSLFTFNTQAQAEAASQALLDQVLIDIAGNPQAQLDTDPTKLRGCEDPLQCLIHTLFNLNTTHPVVHYVETMAAVNNLNEYGDTWYIEWDDNVIAQNRHPDYRPGEHYPGDDCGGCYETYAIWSVQESPPGPLLAIGILGMIVIRRLSNQKGQSEVFLRACERLAGKGSESRSQSGITTF